MLIEQKCLLDLHNDKNFVDLIGILINITKVFFLMYIKYQ